MEIQQEVKLWSSIHFIKKRKKKNIFQVLGKVSLVVVKLFNGVNTRKGAGTIKSLREYTSYLQVMINFFLKLKCNKPLLCGRDCDILLQVNFFHCKLENSVTCKTGERRGKYASSCA